MHALRTLRRLSGTGAFLGTLSEAQRPALIRRFCMGLTAGELTAEYSQAFAAFQARVVANLAACEVLRQSVEIEAALDQDVQDAVAAVVIAIANVGQGGGEATLSAALETHRTARLAAVGALDAELAALREGNKLGAAEEKLVALVQRRAALG